MKKDDLVYVGHIKNCLGKIEKYTKELTIESFLKSEITQQGIIRYFEIIGEATTKISMDFKNKHTQVPWGKMKAMRNFLIHDYDEIDLNLVWDTIQIDVPGLKNTIEEILND